jgi:hypothetical protein
MEKSAMFFVCIEGAKNFYELESVFKICTEDVVQ